MVGVVVAWLYFTLAETLWQGTVGKLLMGIKVTGEAGGPISWWRANARYWAKTGLDIKAGASFELVVPPEWRGRLSIAWGNGAPRTTRLQVAACRWMASPSQSSPARAWLGFAGGYWVRNPACVSLLVRAGHQTRRVHIGIGAACPGQSPPLVHTPSAS
jgi:uncharacterized RDD family membrane protein YckC